MDQRPEDLMDAPINLLIYEKNKLIVAQIADMCVKDKRRLFATLRKKQPLDTINYMFPQFHGITLGEFCVSHVLQSDLKRLRKTDTSTTREPSEPQHKSKRRKTWSGMSLSTKSAYPDSSGSSDPTAGWTRDGADWTDDGGSDSINTTATSDDGIKSAGFTRHSTDSVNGGASGAGGADRADPTTNACIVGSGASGDSSTRVKVIPRLDALPTARLTD